MRRTSTHPEVDDDWTYSETIDETRSAIRVVGRVDRLGVDLLRGTIEDLRRRGHRTITVTIEHPDTIDAVASEVLVDVAEWLTGLDGHLAIRWSVDARSGRTGTGRPSELDVGRPPAARTPSLKGTAP